MMPAKPLDRFPLIRTRNVEEVRIALARTYAKPELIPEGRVRTLRAKINYCQTQHVRLNYATYGAAVRLEFPETNLVSQIFPIRGKCQALVEGTSVSIDAERSVVISPSATVKVRNDTDYERLVLSVDSIALISKLTTMTGKFISGPLRMDPAQTFTRPEAQIFRDHFMFLVSELNTTAAPLPALVLAEVEQTLMVMFLHANRHNYSHLLECQVPNVAPLQVRRAEEYIEANWDQPITLEDLAAVTGVSVLSLARSFRQSRGYSPMEFVKQVRLRQKAKP